MAKGYDDALKKSAEKLRRIPPEQTAENCGAEWLQEEGILKINYLDETCSIKYPEIEFLDGQSLTDKEKVLILHYLSSSPAAVRSTGETYIGFREIKTGNIYFPSFEDRVIKPLVSEYGKTPESFVQKALAAGGQKSVFSVYSVIFRLFPMISVVFVLYPADEELPAGAAVLFHPSITGFLDIEDIAIACEEITSLIMQ